MHGARSTELRANFRQRSVRVGPMAHRQEAFDPRDTQQAVALGVRTSLHFAPSAGGLLRWRCTMSRGNVDMRQRPLCALLGAAIFEQLLLISGDHMPESFENCNLDLRGPCDLCGILMHGKTRPAWRKALPLGGPVCKPLPGGTKETSQPARDR